jgi:RNA polymerase sigma factor (sigma-70 family)
LDTTDTTVYIVDDDTMVRNGTARLVRSLGMHAETFSSAQEFLDFDTPDTPSCVVLDVRMPGLTGMDLQKEMVRRDLQLPIVFVTGHGDIPMSVQAMKKGAQDFLTKPFDEEELIAAIDRAIECDAEQRVERTAKDEILQRVDRLTPREREVLALVVTGMLNKQVAGQLGTTEKTVKVHRARAMKKMQAGSLADAVRMTEKIGLSADNQPSAVSKDAPPTSN